LELLFQVQIPSSLPKLYSQGKLSFVIKSGFSQNNGTLFIGFFNIYDPKYFFIYDKTQKSMFIYNFNISSINLKEIV